MSTHAVVTPSLPAGSKEQERGGALGRVLQLAREFALPGGAISVIFVMLIPLPAMALDLLLAVSMAGSVLVFLSAVQVRKAVDFSVFPTLLLLLTLFRLSLNIASSRRILLHGGKERRLPAA